tara:strand:- start:84932 stop:86191 length:1260 start_codon:yes stop_codon:yes gene_type:complete
MRKLFAILLVALLLGVGVVAVIETDPGYVLVSYGNYTLETSLWVGLLLLILFTLAVYITLRLVYRLIGGQHSLVSWWGDRKARRASQLTTQGMLSYVEGNWGRARRQLLNGARNNDAPLVNYLMAAQSSARLDEPGKVNEYLGAAGDSAKGAGIAIKLTQAELALDAGEYAQARDLLLPERSHAARTPRVLSLMHQACLGLQDWSALRDLLPDLKKHNILPPAQLEQLEVAVHTRLLEQSVSGGDEAERQQSLRSAWQTMPAALRQSPVMLVRYVQLLRQQNEHSIAEKLLLKSIRQQWDSSLVRQYGLVEGVSAPRQLTEAESWLPAHPQDAELLLCLGRLSARDKLWGKARDYFEQSYRLQRTPEVCAELGRLLTALGEPLVAGAYFREGLLAGGQELPTLPLPQNVSPQRKLIAGN